MKGLKVLHIFFASLTILALAVSAQAALSWDGQSGVFLNSLAYPLTASTVETSSHTLNLDALGSVDTYNVAFGLKNNVEISATRYQSHVDGVKDQNVVSAKWQFVTEKSNSPAISLTTTHRDLIDGDNTLDFGLIATKIYKLKEHPVVIDLGAVSTKSLGFGLFGINDDRKTKFEGALAYYVTKNFVIGTEFKQQIDADTWKDIAFRYAVSDKLNLDAGIADFGGNLDNQVAFAVTYKL